MSHQCSELYFTAAVKQAHVKAEHPERKSKEDTPIKVSVSCLLETLRIYIHIILMFTRQHSNSYNREKKKKEIQ